MTERQLISRFFRIEGRNNKLVAANIFFFGGWESDLLVLKDSGYIYEMEIKLTRSDLKKDREKKGRWDTGMSKDQCILSGNGPNRFFYLLSEDLYEKCVDIIPPWAGVWLYKPEYGYSLYKHKESQLFHHRKATEADKIKILMPCYWKNFERVKGLEQ